MAQLQLRKGFVRCVHCTHIFDGYEAVVPEAGDTADLSDHPVQMQTQVAQVHTPGQTPVYAPGQTQAHAQAQPRVSDAPAVIRQRHVVTLPGAADDIVDPAHGEAFSISDVSPASVDDEPVWRLDDAQDDSHASSHAAEQAIYTERRVPPVPVPSTPPDFLDDAAPQRMLWVWCALGLLALILLLAQAAVTYRVQIASQFPAARPALERLCGVWGCQVGYPRRLDQIVILSSSLRMQPRTDQTPDADGRAPFRLTLHLALRNQDERPQQWPALRLDLTDVSGAVVIRKHLHAADYLPPELAGQPFAARSELALRLPMQVQGAVVNGYQITPFFP